MNLLCPVLERNRSLVAPLASWRPGNSFVVRTQLVKDRNSIVPVELMDEAKNALVFNRWVKKRSDVKTGCVSNIDKVFWGPFLVYSVFWLHVISLPGGNMIVARRSPFNKFLVLPMVDPNCSEWRMGPVCAMNQLSRSHPHIKKRGEKRRTLKLGSTELKTNPGLFSSTQSNDSFSDSTLEAT